MKEKILKFLMTFVLFAVVSGGICTKNVNASGFDTSVREGIAVVAIVFEHSDGGESGFGRGTCFFVGKSGSPVEYLVTNYHVIDAFVQYGAGEYGKYVYEYTDASTGKKYSIPIEGKCKVRVYYDMEDNEEAYIVDYDEKKDIAVLKLDTPSEKRKSLPICSPTDSMVGRQIYVVGYPGLSDNTYVDSTSKWKMSDSSVTSGMISRLLTEAGTGVRHIQTDAEIQHGNSGGPMVDNDGYVIGINASNVTSASISGSGIDIEKNQYAINIDELIPMMDSHNVPYEVKGSGMVMTIIIIAAAVAVVVIIVVVLVLILKRKGSSPNKQKKVKGDMQNQNPIKRQAFVRSMALQHNGARFPVTGQKILLGRDTSACNIVFKGDTPGISSRHCSLSWDGQSQEFILIDLNSTYGTFLANGQRLTSGMPYHLRAGDRFYLGESANIMSVEVE